MLEFDSIYFDSEPLVGSRWPNISVALKNVLVLSRYFDVRLFLPLATEMELEEHWYREIALMCSGITASVQKLNKALRYVSIKAPELNLPDEASVRTQYRAAVQRVKEGWGIQPVPLTARGIEEVFTMAIHQFPPFKEEGAGFQDTVIYMSVIDYLRETGRAGAYLSNDGIFKKQRERILQMARTAGARLRLYRTLTELGTALEKELGDEIGRAMEHDRARAAHALNARKPQIEEFLGKNVEIPKSHPFIGDLIEVQRIEMVSIEYVITTYRKEGEPTNISFQALIKAYVLLDTSSYAFFRGSLGIKAEGESAEGLPEQPKVMPHALEYRVEVEATASDQFDDIQLLSAKIRTY